MKKSIKYIICVCLLLIFGITLTVCIYCLTKPIPKYVSCLDVDKTTNTLTTKSEEIKILQLTDTQISSVAESVFMLDIVKKTIKKSKPDMIVLTGDNISDFSTQETAQYLVNFMDSFKLPWALVFGNHDYNSLVSAKDLSTLYESSEYCLYKTGTIEDSYGNYTYTIKKDNKSVYSLIFMDSGKTGFNNKHVEWYENEINKITLQSNGEVVNSMVFFHIPIEEIGLAYNLYQEDPSIGSGVKNEPFCIQDTNVGLFNKALELGSTKAFIFGHDHINNLVLDYKGIKLCYGLKSGKTSYYYATMQGGNLYTITANNQLKIDRIYV